MYIKKKKENEGRAKKDVKRESEYLYLIANFVGNDIILILDKTEKNIRKRKRE